MAKKKKLTKAERKEARLRKGKQWLDVYKRQVRDFFQRFFSLFAKHIVCTASTTTNEISGEFVTVFSMNFRKIFGNVQKHLLQHILCQIRIAHNFVSGMVDQPLVGIIYIYKLFFVALIVKNS